MTPLAGESGPSQCGPTGREATAGSQIDELLMLPVGVTVEVLRIRQPGYKLKVFVEGFDMSMELYILQTISCTLCTLIRTPSITLHPLLTHSVP